MANSTIVGVDKNDLLGRSPGELESSACAPRVLGAEVYWGGPNISHSGDCRYGRSHLFDRSNRRKNKCPVAFHYLSLRYLSLRFWS